MALISCVLIFMDWAKITHSWGSKFVAIALAFSWVLDFLDQTLDKSHENWYPMDIKPSTVCELKFDQNLKNIVAAFCGMHVSPAKHSYSWLPRKCDYLTYARTHRQTDRQTDAGESDSYVPLCFAGDTKVDLYCLQKVLSYISIIIVDCDLDLENQ